MKIYFIDAENVGFKGLEVINANIIDKVFIFSRVESIIQHSEKNYLLVYLATLKAQIKQIFILLLTYQEYSQAYQMQKNTLLNSYYFLATLA